MHILELRAENLKRLRAVRIRPGGKVVEITGRNGQGKTSVLDAIFWALAGARAAQDKPIRDGQAKATVRLDMGDVIVTRVFRESAEGRLTTQLTVESAEGARFKSPQAMLDGLLGTLSFDPLAFSRAPAREQYETLAGFVADVDVPATEAEHEADYDLRRQANKKAREAEAAAAAVEVPEDAPQEPVSIEDLTAELRKAEAANTERGRLERERVRARQQLEIARERQDEDLAELARLKETALRLKGNVDARRERIGAMEAEQAAAPPLPDRVDTAGIMGQMEDAAALNAAYELRGRRRELEGLAEEARENSRVIDQRMKNRREAFTAAVAAADMPVEGLTLEGGAVLLDGVPLDQASDAEQLRLSCACAMRQNADLRVLRVRDGSLLDDDSMGILRELAAEHDYQVWIERVGDGADGMGFVIEDGAVAAEPA